MEHYQDAQGDSGIRAYETGRDYIDVVFHDGSVYRYDYEHPGKEKTEAMKRHAREGQGLNTYINQHVRENFSRRLD